MLLTADQHARIAARLRAKASQRKLAPLELLRLLEIAQRFEALSARDRPYKKGKTVSECLAIMRNMAQNNHLDADLFEIFERERVYLRYAQEFMHPDQIDDAVRVS